MEWTVWNKGFGQLGHLWGALWPSPHQIHMASTRDSRHCWCSGLQGPVGRRRCLPVVSSQGLTSMMMRDLVSLAFSAPRFLAAAITASFSSFAFFSSCTQNTKLQTFALMHVM